MEEVITRLIILGAGGFGRTIADIAKQLKTFDEIFFLDDKAEAAIGTISEADTFIDDNTVFYPAIGNNIFRCELIDRIVNAGGNIASIVHPSSYISVTAKMGIGVAVLPHASIGTNVIISDGCILNMNSVIDHDVILECGVHIAPGAIVKGENHISAFTKIDSGNVVERGEYK